MALDKNKVDDLLVDFVVRNESDLALSKEENPALYDSVMSALSILAKRYGSGQGMKPVIPEPVVQPIAPPDDLGFEVGDIFYNEDDKETKYHIQSIDTDSGIVEVGYLDRVKGSSKYEIDQVSQYFGTGVWVKTGNKFMPLPNKPMYFKVGDVFYHKDSKKEKYYIASIDKDDSVVLVGSVDGSFSGTTRYDLDEANRLMNSGIWIFTGEIHMPTPKPAAIIPTLLPIKLNDIIFIVKDKQEYVVRHIDPYTDDILVAKIDTPNVTDKKFSFSDSMAYINKGLWIINPKPTPKKSPDPVTKAIKKTAGKTKKAVSPEEKEILEAIKNLKPLLEFDADIQLEINALNQKLQAIRNQ